MHIQWYTRQGVPPDEPLDDDLLAKVARLERVTALGYYTSTEDITNESVYTNQDVYNG